MESGAKNPSIFLLCLLGRKEACLGISLLVVISLVTASSAASLPADTIFFNATFYVSFSSKTDGHVTAASALAVSGGRVVHHGDAEGARKLHLGPETETVDLGGRFVVPGLIDSHLHFIDGGMQLSTLSLREVKSLEELREKVREAVQGLEPGEWLVGNGWNEHKWTRDGGTASLEMCVSQQLEGDEEGSKHKSSSCEASNVSPTPHMSWIDDLTPHNPVLLTRVDGHVALANSAALSAAGVTRGTPDPPGGEFARDSHGQLTGLLQELAIGAVSKKIPPATVARRREGLFRAQEEALRHGVTAVVDLGRYYPGSTDGASWEDLELVYLPADEAGEMAVRVHTVLPLTTWPRLEAWIRERGHSSSDFLSWGLLKAFADGSVGSRTALFHAPYADTDSSGIQLVDFEWLAKTVAEVGQSEQRMGIAVHAIGDAAVTKVLDSFEQAEDALKLSAGEEGGRNVGTSQHWWRIEHSQHVRPQDVGRFKDLGVVASMQPYHLPDDVGVLESALGSERARDTSYHFKLLLEAAPALALGSDWPVVTLDPFEGILAGGHWTTVLNTWNLRDAREALSPGEALRGYTQDAADACRWADIGSLEAGRLADMVVLDVDPLTAVIQGIKPKVLRTYVAGRCLYDSSGSG